MKAHVLLTVAVVSILGVVAGPPIHAGAVNELHNHDTAFALLAEAYRSVQDSIIQSDYQSRLAAARHESDPRDRQAISRLADMERHLRETKLTTQVAQLQIAYGYARRADERRLGVDVPQQPDRQVVNRKLREILPTAVLEADTPVFYAAGLASLDALLHSAPEPAARMAAPELPASCSGLANLLKRAYGPTHPLVNAVKEAFQHPILPDEGLTPEPPAFALVTYRKSGETIHDVVVQVLHPDASETSAKAVRSSRTSDPQKAEMSDRIDQWLTLLNQATGRWYGDARLVDERHRVFDQVLHADLTFVQQQTTEPLYIVAILPNPHAYLPSCLQKRVTGIVAEADLGQLEWQGTAHLMTVSPEMAEQTAGLLESWRMLLTSLLSSGEVKTGTAKPCRRVIDAGTIKVNGSHILVTGTSPALMGLHGTDRLLQWAIADAH